jgi:hypothetical protein
MKFLSSIVLLFSLLIGINSQTFGQLYFPEDLVKITARVVDSSTGQGISSVQVLNYRIHGGTMTDSGGNFSIQADPADTLTFKLLGYQDKKIPVKEFIDNNLKSVVLNINRFQIPEVKVEGKGKPLNFGIGGKENPIPAELRSEDFASKPKLLSAIFNPLAFMHYKLSKSEKEKRMMLAAIYSERDWQLLSLVYNKDIVQRITSLTGEDLDDFMVYCNAYSGFKANATTYEVHKTVKDLFTEYKKTHTLKNSPK